jgi:hypothetical protein
MPFTPAHVSMVLPLLRIKPQHVSATALVIGSMAPDFEYFLKMSVSGVYGHTLLGIFYFDVPIAIVLALLFHGLIKKNLISNLPAFFQYRFHDLVSLDFRAHLKSHYWVVIISAGIGSFTHIIWDAFTHNDGFFVQRISLYKYVYIPFNGVRYPLFYALQHLSTMVGLSILIWYICLMKPHEKILVSRPSFGYWALVLLISCGVVFLRFSFNRQSLNLGNFVVSSISAILVALLLSGFVKFKSISSN